MYSEILTPDYHMAHNISHVTSENYLIHSHPFYELYYFLSGDVHLLYNGAEYILHPHTFVIFIPNIFHGLHVLTQNPYERYTAHFTPDILSVDRRHMLMSALPDAEDLCTTPPQVPFMLEDAQSTGILSLFQSFDQIAHMPEHLRDTLVSTVTEAILARFLLCTADAGRTKPITPFHKGHNELVPILDFIHQNLQQPISLNLLSERFHVSKGKLNSLFHSQMHMTTMEYVTQRRIRYAQQLLINGIPASQAYGLVGFEDYTGFYRAYKKVTGRAPSEDSRPATPSMEKGLWNVASNLHQIPLMDSPETEDSIWVHHTATQVTDVDIAVLRDP